MTEPVEIPTEPQPLSVFVTHADSMAGRAIVAALIGEGAKVAGSTTHGTRGAAAIRRLGAVPTYTDLSREADIRSTLLMTKADLIVDLSTTLLNDLPYAKTSLTPAMFDVVPLLNAAHEVGVKQIVYVGFLGALGASDHHDHDSHGQPALADEHTELRRDNDIFRALARAESVLVKSDFNVVVLRAGYLYGQHSAGMDALNNALRAGRPVADGPGSAPLLYLQDLVSAVLTVIHSEHVPSRVYHITGDTPMTFDAFAQRFSEMLGVGAPLHLPILSAASGLQATLLNQSVHASNGLAKAELGWSPAYPTVNSGLEHMLLQWRASEALALPAPVTDDKALVPVAE